jgi:N6-adenosine-specific RNA methylase IME4
MGIGNYWRLSHEFLLLGVRGSLVFDAKDLMSWAALDRTSHSSKPPEIRGMVERASPGPYLELFGRKEVKGWHVWGNQIKGEEFRQGAFA